MIDVKKRRYLLTKVSYISLPTCLPSVCLSIYLSYLSIYLSIIIYPFSQSVDYLLILLVASFEKQKFSFRSNVAVGFSFNV